MLLRYRWGKKGTANMGDAADEIERLRKAIRRLADQDATLSVQGGNVTVTMDATLTNDERRAIKFAIEIFEVEGKNATFEQLTLRRLLKYTLERLLERTA